MEVTLHQCMAILESNAAVCATYLLALGTLLQRDWFPMRIHIGWVTVSHSSILGFQWPRLLASLHYCSLHTWTPRSSPIRVQSRDLTMDGQSRAITKATLRLHLLCIFFALGSFVWG